ncbi:MAG: ATP-dependent helicase HrpB [Planctomycetes bacterium]|nr:ATP-dependent helicase HrpB [Planctomycetota bacterium]
MPTLPPLPIDEALPRLIAALRTHGVAVLEAPTGAGKTTRVPPALLDAGLAGAGAVLLVEPRRIAARAAAQRIAEERGVRAGDEVGWHVRFEPRFTARTRILALTEGLFVRRVQSDPALEGVGCVIFDEIHERNLDGDLGLALAREIRGALRPDLRLVAMSATLDAEPLARWLGDAPVVASQGFLHPVELRYRSPAPRTPLEQSVVEGVRELLEATTGDVLVFLPGVGEIRRAASSLASTARAARAEVQELYGDLPAEQQDRALRRGSTRRIVLATNVAETSVTVEGVTAVLDTGLARVLRHDPRVGLNRLVLEKISRASADQRSGRAGRLAPGICLRLWSAAEHRSLPAFQEPEVRRIDLAGAVLELKRFGEHDAARFGWLEAPRPEALAKAEELLRRLGALDAHGRLSSRGEAMAELPLHPRLAALLLAGARRGIAPLAALAAALLSERDPLRASDPRVQAPACDSDLVERVQALHAFERSGSLATRLGELHEGGARAVLRVRDQLLRTLRERRESARERAARESNRETDEEALLHSLLDAFPDRVAKRRAAGAREAVMVGGRGIRLHPRSGVIEPELFLCLDADAGAGETIVHSASRVEREWLARERIEERIDVEFDPERARVVGWKRVCYEDLALEEAPTAPRDPARIEALLAAEAAKDLRRALPLEEPEVAAFLQRVAFLREHLPELEWPRFDDAELRELLPELCAGARSFADLRKSSLLDLLRARLGGARLQALEREAPERLPVPSGSRITLQYEGAKAPVLAARIQELFGLADTPRVARGRVKVLLHLLAPNHRPQQVTDDLRSFWDNAYHEVKKELRRRYPRHAWPDDPWTAPPERRPRRRPD